MTEDRGRKTAKKVLLASWVFVFGHRSPVVGLTDVIGRSHQLIMDETLQAQLNVIKEADLVICLPSYNSARTIGHVIRTIANGLTGSFPGIRAVLINSDGGSTDGTQEEVRKAQTESVSVVLTSHSVDAVQKIDPPYHGIPGKEKAFRTAFEITGFLHAGACAVFDSDSSSIAPEWLEAFLRPVYENAFDCVFPLYARHRFDGTLTNGIVYPLTRALYGKRVRQIIAREFAFSGEFVKFALTKEVWNTDVALFGTDIWLATLAICEGYAVCQSFLGAKVYDKGPELDLGSLFTQVMSPVFLLMEDYHPFWRSIRETQPVPAFGQSWGPALEPVTVNVEGMIRTFRLAVANLVELWRNELSPKMIRSLQSLSRSSDETFSFPGETWAQAIYDFAVAHHRGRIHRDHLLKSMIPLYLGWVASFVKENRDRSDEDVETGIESLCKTFEEMKPYLINHWNATPGGGSHG